MKILYAIQGTGNGHLSRAKDVIPALKERAEVAILVSGTQAEVKLSYPVDFKYKGLSFYFGKRGGINFFKTIFKNNPVRIIREIRNCPVQDYDLVINDFEPITAWACKSKKVPIISLSHQGILYSENVPKPRHNDFIGSFIIKNYAKCTHNYGFHFKQYNEKVFTPVVRSEVRNLTPTQGKHYLVYLPAYSDVRIIRVLSQLPDIQWKVFSKHAKNNYKSGNVMVHKISSKLFEEALSSCVGILCGAGFETPAEALFLGKKLMVIPMKNQYEQHFNARGLEDLGIPVLKSFSHKSIPKLKKWVDSTKKTTISFPDETQKIVEEVLKFGKKLVDHK